MSITQKSLERIIVAYEKISPDASLQSTEDKVKVSNKKRVIQAFIDNGYEIIYDNDNDDDDNDNDDNDDNDNDNDDDDNNDDKLDALEEEIETFSSYKTLEELDKVIVKKSTLINIFTDINDGNKQKLGHDAAIKMLKELLNVESLQFEEIEKNLKVFSKSLLSSDEIKNGLEILQKYNAHADKLLDKHDLFAITAACCEEGLFYETDNNLPQIKKYLKNNASPREKDIFFKLLLQKNVKKDIEAFIRILDYPDPVEQPLLYFAKLMYHLSTLNTIHNYSSIENGKQPNNLLNSLCSDIRGLIAEYIAEIPAKSLALLLQMQPQTYTYKKNIGDNWDPDGLMYNFITTALDKKIFKEVYKDELLGKLVLGYFEKGALSSLESLYDVTKPNNITNILIENRVDALIIENIHNIISNRLFHTELGEQYPIDIYDHRIYIRKYTNLYAYHMKKLIDRMSVGHLSDEYLSSKEYKILVLYLNDSHVKGNLSNLRHDLLLYLLINLLRNGEFTKELFLKAPELEDLMYFCVENCSMEDIISLHNAIPSNATLYISNLLEEELISRIYTLEIKGHERERLLKLCPELYIKYIYKTIYSMEGFSYIELKQLANTNNANLNKGFAPDQIPTNLIIPLCNHALNLELFEEVYESKLFHDSISRYFQICSAKEMALLYENPSDYNLMKNPSFYSKAITLTSEEKNVLKNECPNLYEIVNRAQQEVQTTIGNIIETPANKIVTQFLFGDMPKGKEYLKLPKVDDNNVKPSKVQRKMVC